MAEWTKADIGQEEEQSDSLKPDTTGLLAQPQLMHSEFHNAAEHLHEVRAMHEQVLVTAGMLPETHVSETNPSMQLEWVIKELNARIDPDGLTIPLLGATFDDIEIQYRKEGELIEAKLTIHDGDNPPLERTLPLPDVESIENINANYSNGRLRLRW